MWQLFSSYLNKIVSNIDIQNTGMNLSKGNDAIFYFSV